MKKFLLALGLAAAFISVASAQSLTPKFSSEARQGNRQQILQNMINNMVRVAPPSGSKYSYFKMGTTGNPQNPASENASPIHEVYLSTYWISKFEVTQEEYEAVMGAAANHSLVKGKDLPVTNVSWNDAIKFCEKLKSLTGIKFVLPTEAQWELAARGGDWVNSHYVKYSGPATNQRLSDLATCLYNTEYAMGYGSNLAAAQNDRTKALREINSTGTYVEKYRKAIQWDVDHKVRPRTRSWVKSNLKPNNLGIYDMSGGVSEWCYDSYEWNYPSKKQTDPVVKKGDSKVYRGGNYTSTTSSETSMAFVWERSGMHGTAKDALGNTGHEWLGFRIAIW